MCVSKENTDPQDFVKFHEFVMTLDGEQPFTQLLNSIGIMLEQGGTICLAMPQMPEQMGQDAEQQQPPQALPPGIYPPAPIGDDRPQPGTGQYL